MCWCKRQDRSWFEQKVTVSKQDLPITLNQLPAKRDQILANITKSLFLVRFYKLTRELS